MLIRSAYLMLAQSQRNPNTHNSSLFSVALIFLPQSLILFINRKNFLLCLHYDGCAWDLSQSAFLSYLYELFIQKDILHLFSITHSIPPALALKTTILYTLYFFSLFYSSFFYFILLFQNVLYKFPYSFYFFFIFYVSYTE